MCDNRATLKAIISLEWIVQNQIRKKFYRVE